MQYKNILNKFSGYLHSASIELSKWLEGLLPKIKNNWWEDCVKDKLSFNQQQILKEKKITTLKDFDLSALLRIAHKNWYEIYQIQKFALKYSLKELLREEMPKVRNNWAHNPVAPKKDLVIKDLETIIDFFSHLNAESRIISDAKETLKLIKSEGINEEHKDLASKALEKNEPEKTLSQSDITINTIVHLKSDPNIKGIVKDVREIGAIKQFGVFIDGKIKTYFADQIEIEVVDTTPKEIGIGDIIRKLTAYQIKQPSSESLYSLNAARVDFVPYQFRPALKIIKSDTPRLLIADGVGVGKTIEAGLILKELQARTPLDSVLIICPKPLVVEHKWENEMKRFDESFVSANGNELRNIIKETNDDDEWPDKWKRLILPYSLLKKNILEGLENLNINKLFDLVIVDEAHHIRSTNTQAYKTVKFFCERSTAAIFMTATPIQLGNDDLFTLLNLLFPIEVMSKQAFEAMAEPNIHINSALSHLRQRNDLSNVITALENASATEWGKATIAKNPLYHQVKQQLSVGELTREQKIKAINDIESFHSFSNMINRTRRQDIGDFCVRRAETLESDFTEYQIKLHDSLLKFEADVLGVLHGNNMPIEFLMSTISRQAASCIFGLAPTLKAFTEKRLSQIMDEYDYDEEIDIGGIDINAFLPKAKEIIELAKNLPDKDPKFDRLSEILKEKQKHSNNKIIIFSTFRHTLSYLKKRITEIGLRVEQINGSVNDDERYSLRQCFELPKIDPQALDILLFTEVGSEGLDYQFCDTVINYDLPWNPMRIEQRIGRIDRRGQKSDVVHIYNCITSGTIDAEIYNRCLLRIGVFEQSIGECSDILGKITYEIQEITFNINLTEEERTKKLEQLADNAVKHMQEMKKLEDEQKQMLGLDISSFTEDVEKAENPWIDPLSLKNLILGYLQNLLNSNKTYIKDKRLSLTIEEKSKLYEDYKKIGGNQNENSWKRFLKNKDKTNCRITFEQEEAKDPKALFITPTHPFIHQAAAYIADGDEMRTALKVTSTDIASGEYPFLLFAWKYTGNRPRVELVAICEDEIAQAELPAIIKSAVQIEVQFDRFVPYWNKLEEKHHSIFQSKRNDFREETQKNCRFKLESLTRTIDAGINFAKQQLEQATNQKIITMRTSEIERLKTTYNEKKNELEKSLNRADIHTTKFVSGVLIVEG